MSHYFFFILGKNSNTHMSYWAFKKGAGLFDERNLVITNDELEEVD